MAINFRSILSVFSRRPGIAGRQLASIPQTFRQRFLMILMQRLSGEEGHWHEGDYRRQFLCVLRQQLLFSTGLTALTSERFSSPEDEVLRFIFSCSALAFIDAMELAFAPETMSLLRISPQDDALIDTINAVLRADDLPYWLTNYVWETSEEMQYGNLVRVDRVTHFPQVIRREDDVIHAQAVEPTLHVLAQKGLEAAHTEFLEALADYQKMDYGDCLVKCGSSFESVLKSICHKRGWSYKQTDTAAPLLKIVLDQGGLDSFFEQPLLLVGTIRNRLSKAHGAGVASKSAPQHIARYAINATAAAILLLTDDAWR
jgi:Domain of unknown function (DUF7014)